MLVPWRVFIYNDKHLSHLSDGLLGPTLQEVGWSKVESQIWLGQPWAHSRQPVLATWFCGFSGPGVYSRRNVNAKKWLIASWNAGQSKCSWVILSDAEADAPAVLTLYVITKVFGQPQIASPWWQAVLQTPKLSRPCCWGQSLQRSVPRTVQGAQTKIPKATCWIVRIPMCFVYWYSHPQPGPYPEERKIACIKIS